MVYTWMDMPGGMVRYPQICPLTPFLAIWPSAFRQNGFGIINDIIPNLPTYTNKIYVLYIYHTRPRRIFKHSNAIRNGNVQITLRASTQYIVALHS